MQAKSMTSTSQLRRSSKKSNARRNSKMLLAGTASRDSKMEDSRAKPCKEGQVSVPANALNTF